MQHSLFSLSLNINFRSSINKVSHVNFIHQKRSTLLMNWKSVEKLALGKEEFQVRFKSIEKRLLEKPSSKCVEALKINFPIFQGSRLFLWFLSFAFFASCFSSNSLHKNIFTSHGRFYFFKEKKPETIFLFSSLYISYIAQVSFLRRSNTNEVLIQKNVKQKAKNEKV